MPSRQLVVSVEEDRRAGERANGVTRLGRALKVLRGRTKEVSIPTDAITAGWSSYGPGGGPMYRTGPRRLAQLATAYGGTNDSVTWVFACVVKISAEGASYPYHFEDLLDETVEAPPDDLLRLLRKPNEAQGMTYFDMVEAVLTDLELLGNSYWLKDRRNGYGQPLEVIRLIPENLRIAVAMDGRELGYVYSGPGGVQIPYDLDEVIHYKYPNPLDEHYGMGTVEAIARALDQEIAQSLHVTGFFQNGARISGILTVPEVLTETQFQRTKHQFQEEFAGAANAFKVLIAEGGSGASPDFKPVTQNPGALGVVDLRKLSKDEILSGFGVPEFLIGGAAQAGVYKMEEATHIFTRGMIPRVTRFQERISADLLGLWGDLQLKVEPHANEPLSVKIEHASAMLGAGATVDESREAMGQPALNTEATRVPLVPANLITIDQSYARPAELIPVPTPASGKAPPPGPGELPAAPAPPELEVTTETPDPEQAAEETEDQEPAKRGGARPKVGRKVARHPALPPGYEVPGPQRKGSSVPPETWDGMAEHHASVLVQATPAVRAGMVEFFTAQRGRVTGRLAEYGPSSRRTSAARLKSGPQFTKDSLTPESLWHEEEENRALRETYLPLVDHVGGLTLDEAPSVAGVEIRWDVRHPKIEQARARLAEKVTRVNDTTRAALADAVDTGLKRGYSVVQIATGVPAESYGGVLGVFDQAVHDRAETIARTETALAYNAASTAGYADAGVEHVEVSDGVEYDEECAEADGQVWTIDEAEADDLEHPNCTRSFLPVTDEPAEGETSAGEPEGEEGYGAAGAAFEAQFENDLATGDVGTLDAMDSEGINTAYRGDVGGHDVIVKPDAETYSAQGAGDSYFGLGGGEPLREGIPPGEDSVRERAAYLVAQRMGVPVPTTVARDLPDYGPSTVSRVAAGESGGDVSWRTMDAADVRQIGLFDAVIGNTDRHWGNVLARWRSREDIAAEQRPGVDHPDADYRVVPIDHGLAFPEGPAYNGPGSGNFEAQELAANSFGHRYRPEAAGTQALTEAETAQLRSMLGEARGELAPALEAELRAAGLSGAARELTAHRIRALVEGGEIVGPDVTLTIGGP